MNNNNYCFDSKYHTLYRNPGVNSPINTITKCGSIKGLPQELQKAANLKNLNKLYLQRLQTLHE
jgi:hypothetical protein